MEEQERNRTGPTETGPAELARLEEELRRERELHLRALADFDNYRKRVERERATLSRAGKREILLRLLEVVDDFERALPHMGDTDEAIAEGFKALHRKLVALLESQEVRPLDSAGRPFDPSLHETIGVVATGDFESGTIAEELQRGYCWGDELLRPARVRVAA